MKSPTQTFDRREGQKKQNREWMAARQKDPSFSQNEDVIKEKDRKQKKNQLNLSPDAKEAAREVDSKTIKL